MDDEEKIVLSYEGLKKLEDELADLKINQRREIAQKIKVAREQGDLSENAEYDAAKNKQAEIEARIVEIDNILKHAEVLDEENLDKETIQFGCTVHFEDMDTKEEFTYKLTGSTEADLLKGSISDKSPIGEMLIGLKAGQVIAVDAPDGKFNYKILDFSRD